MYFSTPSNPKANWCADYAITLPAEYERLDWEEGHNYAYAIALAQAMNDPIVQDLMQKWPVNLLEVSLDHSGTTWKVLREEHNVY